MSPRAAIRETVMCPLKKCYPAMKPFGRGRLLSAQETARLALMGAVDREQAVQALVTRYFSGCQQQH